MSLMLFGENYIINVQMDVQMEPAFQIIRQIKQGVLLILIAVKEEFVVKEFAI